MSEKRGNRSSQAIADRHTSRPSSDATTITRTSGKGRRTTITCYEVDPRDIFDDVKGKPRAPRPPVSVTYYKPTRIQHYASMGPLYGVERKPRQLLRAYARAVERTIAEALSRHSDLAPRSGSGRKQRSSGNDEAE